MVNPARKLNAIFSCLLAAYGNRTSLPHGGCLKFDFTMDVILLGGITRPKCLISVGLRGSGALLATVKLYRHYS